MSALTVDPSSLNEPFDAATTAYTVDVGHEVDSIDVTATLSDRDASMEINSAAVASGLAENIALNAAGETTEITIVVTAEDTTTIKTYTITVDREAAPAPELSGLDVAGQGTTATINEGDSEDVSVTVTNTGGTASFDVFIVFGPHHGTQTITTDVLAQGESQVVTLRE